MTQDLTTQEFDFDDVNLPEDEQSLLARIPLLAGSSRKGAYLAYRATGFTVGKACELARVTKTTVHNWRKNDPVFARIEQEHLEQLQSTVGNDVIRFDFMRSMKLLLHADMTIIAKAVTEGVNKLEPREYDYYKNIRKHYTPGEWLSLEKVLAPEKHKDNNTFNIVLSWGNRIDPNNMEAHVVEGESRELLDEPTGSPQSTNSAQEDTDIFAM